MRCLACGRFLSEAQCDPEWDPAPCAREVLRTLSHEIAKVYGTRPVVS